jgi:hypothetical protein
MLPERFITPWSLLDKHESVSERTKKRIYKTHDLACADVFDYIEVIYNRKRRRQPGSGFRMELMVFFPCDSLTVKMYSKLENVYYCRVHG